MKTMKSYFIHIFVSLKSVLKKIVDTTKIKYKKYICRYKKTKKGQTYVGQLYHFKKMKNLENSLSSFLSLTPKGVQGQKCMLSRKYGKKLHIFWILLKAIF